MQTEPATASPAAAASRKRRDPDLQRPSRSRRSREALNKVSPQAQAKAQKTATDFEAMFLNRCLRR